MKIVVLADLTAYWNSLLFEFERHHKQEQFWICELNQQKAVKKKHHINHQDKKTRSFDLSNKFGFLWNFYASQTTKKQS